MGESNKAWGDLNDETRLAIDNYKNISKWNDNLFHNYLYNLQIPETKKVTLELLSQQYPFDFSKMNINDIKCIHKSSKGHINELSWSIPIIKAAISLMNTLRDKNSQNYATDIIHWIDIIIQETELFSDELIEIQTWCWVWFDPLTNGWARRWLMPHWHRRESGWSESAR